MAWWTLAVIVVVIAIDLTRALASARAARRLESAALASNALHFASDLAGSIAVLIGLVLVRAGEQKADAIAALFVAVLVVIAAVRLARRSIDVLMDRASTDAEEAVRAALEPLPVEVRRVRVRHAAGFDFVDLVIAVAPDVAVGQAHAVADSVEEAVQRALGRSDVVVHVEPRAPEGPLRERVTAAAQTVPDVREIHNVRVIRTGDAYELSLHVKLPPGQPLEEAHEVVSQLEAAIRAAVPEVRDIHTHMEPLADTDWARRPTPREVADQARRDRRRRRAPHRLAPDRRPLPRRRGRAASCCSTSCCRASSRCASRTGARARSRRRCASECPELVDVIVHTEPAREHGARRRRAAGAPGVRSGAAPVRSPCHACRGTDRASTAAWTERPSARGGPGRSSLPRTAGSSRPRAPGRPDPRDSCLNGRVDLRHRGRRHAARARLRRAATAPPLPLGRAPPAALAPPGRDARSRPSPRRSARPSCVRRRTGRRGRTPGRSRTRGSPRPAGAMTPSQVPSKSCSAPSGATRAITQT